MAERYYPRAEAERLAREMLERAHARLVAELPARFAARLRRGERIDRECGEAVDRIMAEELAQTRRELEELAVEGSVDRDFSATRLFWSKGNGGCDDSMKLRSSSSGCEVRPAKGEPARAGSEPGDGLGNEAGEA